MNTVVRVLNPNCTQAMTAAVLAQVRGRLPPGFVALASTASDGPPVIDSCETFVAAAAAAPAFARAAAPGERLLLACFGDPGLEALREAAAPRPVAGLAEAAIAAAVAARQRFAIVTAGPAWVGLLARRVADFGAAAWLTGVHALPANGAQLMADPERWRRALRRAAGEAERGGAQVLILGGAAFAGLGALVETDLPLIDPIDAATAQLTQR